MSYLEKKAIKIQIACLPNEMYGGLGMYIHRTGRVMLKIRNCFVQVCGAFIEHAWTRTQMYNINIVYYETCRNITATAGAATEIGWTFSYVIASGISNGNAKAYFECSTHAHTLSRLFVRWLIGVFYFFFFWWNIYALRHFYSKRRLMHSQIRTLACISNMCNCWILLDRK